MSCNFFLKTTFITGALVLSQVPAVNALEASETVETVDTHLADTYQGIIDNHLNKNFSIMRTVRILINNYPEHATYIVNAAFNIRETRVKAIVVASIQAEPAVTYNVLDSALTRYPQLSDTLIEAAIKTEPAYIDDIITVALSHQPERADIIISKVMNTHPEFAESVLRTSAEQAPNHIFPSIMESLKSLPELATSLVTIVKNAFGDEKSPLVNQGITEDEWKLLMLEAKQSGVKRNELTWLVNEGYVSEERFAQVYTD